MKEIKMYINQYKEEMLKDLAILVAVPSTRDELTKAEDSPFGNQIRVAFDEFMKISQRMNFQIEDFNGYACHALLKAKDAISDDYIGVLGHLDVVEAGDESLWDSDPYCLCQKGDMLFARGVNDDKGPLLAALYATRIIKDLNIPLKYDIRVIAGGAEETTWECVEHYFTLNKQPIMGFSPDGNFPIVNGEKGILQFNVIFNKYVKKKENYLQSIQCKELVNYVCEEVVLKINNVDEEQIKEMIQLADYIKVENHQAIITYKGKRSLSRNPQKGENALWKVAKDLHSFSFAQEGMNQLLNYLYKYYTDDYYGNKAGIYYADKEMGTTSICPMSIIEDGETYALSLDYRYPKGVNKDDVLKYLIKQANSHQANIEVSKEKDLLYVSEDSKLIQGLKKAYKQVMKEDASTLTKGGASYARALDVGVAFGATFENEETKPHMPNEQMSITSLLKACEIYVYALMEMASVK